MAQNSKDKKKEFRIRSLEELQKRKEELRSNTSRSRLALTDQWKKTTQSGSLRKLIIGAVVAGVATYAYRQYQEEKKKKYQAQALKNPGDSSGKMSLLENSLETIGKFAFLLPVVRTAFEYLFDYLEERFQD